MNFDYVLLNEGSKPPELAHDDDAGVDLFAAESVTIPPGSFRSVGLGIAASLSPGYHAFLWGRSGMGAKDGVGVLSGVIDNGYRGEWRAVLSNSGDRPYQVWAGDKVVQAVIQAVPNRRLNKLDKVEDLGGTDRGTAGFGSTGV